LEAFSYFVRIEKRPYLFEMLHFTEKESIYKIHPSWEVMEVGWPALPRTTPV